MAYGFGWVREDVLAGMAFPSGGDAWAWLAEQGVRAVLSLTERPAPGEPAAAGLETLHVPIRDFEAPTLEEMERCLAFITEQVRDGRAVVVHCGAGRGRTGTVLAAWLTADGMRAEDAMDLVRARRPGSIETRAQEDAVRRVERRSA
jgi:atypical dual specificity phosphatase